MKKFMLEFLRRGLLCSVGGPLVLAVVYACIGRFDGVTALAPAEVSIGIFSVSLMAFTAAGITAIYQIERLPLVLKILIHGGVLYFDYLLMYLFNSWIPRDLRAVGIFTAVFVAGFAVIWFVIYLISKRNTDRINTKIHCQ